MCQDMSILVDNDSYNFLCSSEPRYQKLEFILLPTNKQKIKLHKLAKLITISCILQKKRWLKKLSRKSPLPNMFVEENLTAVYWSVLWLINNKINSFWFVWKEASRSLTPWAGVRQILLLGQHWIFLEPLSLPQWWCATQELHRRRGTPLVT